MAENRKYSMQDFFGALLLIGALFAFGLFNFKSDEPLVEAGIRAQTSAIAARTTHDVQITVAGRDIALSGLADTQDERSSILEAVRAIDGRGRISNTLEVLEPAQPFAFTAQIGPDGLTLSGAVPTEAIRDALRTDHGQSADTLILASGAPDTDWASVAQAGLRALGQLSSGTLQLIDQEIRLDGAALTPDIADRARLLLAELPEGYSATAQITTLDDGTPLRLIATRSDGALVSVTGKLPTAMASEFEGEDVTASPIPLPFTGWDAAVAQGLAALEPLQSGHLAIIGTSLTLSGDAWSEAAFARTEAALAALPAAMQVSSDVTLADSGAPFGLTLTRGEGGIIAQGKVPRSLAPPVLAALTGGPVSADALEVARVSPGQPWWQAASLAARAIALMAEGTSHFDGAALTLTGRVPDPQAKAALDAILADLPAEITLTQSLDLIDDGRPMRLALTLAEDRATATGKWPETLDLSALEAALGQGLSPASPVVLAKPAPSGWQVAAEAGAAALGLLNDGMLVLDGRALRLSGVARTPAVEEAARAILATLPDGYTAETALRFFDDGRPFAFRVAFDGTRAQLSGKVPADLGPASQGAIMGVPVEGEALDISSLSADAEWWAAARAALKALALLPQGQLEMDAHQITLQGPEPDAGTAQAIAARLDPLAGAFRITLTFN